MDGALDVVLGDRAVLGLPHGGLERGDSSPGRRRRRPNRRGLAGCPDHGIELPLRQLRAGDEGRDLLLLDHLPVDEGLDIGMVDVDRHHLGGAARRAAGLDGARRAVADLEEAHQAGGTAAARQALAVAAQRGEVGAGARAVFEEPRLAHPEIHDAAIVHEVIGDGLDEAGMRLRMLVGALRCQQPDRSP